MLLTAGISVAAIHVASPVMVGLLSGDRVGRGMSFFMFGGELARTVGPLVALWAVSTFGLPGIWRLIPVAVASSLALWWRLGRAPAPVPARKPAGLLTVWKRMRAVLVAVTGIIITRAFMFGALATFLPTYVYGEGASLRIATVSLSVMELGGAAGAFVTGTLSDRLGRRRVLLAIVALSPLLMVLFLLTGGPARMAVLLVLGFALISTTPVLLAVVVESGGSNQAAATGTFMMVTFAARAVIMLLVGAMGDAFGLRLSYFICAGFAALGIPFVLMLPGRRASAV
jgi:FSR family fosmidomycin resistance protein-like MFS transporter